MYDLQYKPIKFLKFKIDRYDLKLLVGENFVSNV